VDLGAWASEQHKVAGDPLVEETGDEEDGGKN
jgi:endogenous inhibitor of DNA gyrase (YacG/DUF329 family)